MTGVIYKATNKINGKSYIGQTINFNKRQLEHRRAKDDYVFHRAIRKYGFENFDWEILEQCEQIRLNEREEYWIKYYDTYYSGYNSTQGGDNADALLNWKKNNKDKELEYAINGLKAANIYNETHKEEFLERQAKAREKGAQARKRKVRCIDLDLVFDGLSDAERWSVSDNNPNKRKAAHQHISKVCNGQRHTAGGYAWEYVE